MTAGASSTMLLARNRHTRSLTLPDTIDLAGPGTFGDLAAMSDDGRVVDATFDRGITGVGGVAVVDVRRRSVIDTWDYPVAGRLHGARVLV